MKANELMIGDWVILKETHSSHKITRADFWGSEGSFKEFEPIPLTEDILRANEFIHIEDYGSWTKDCFSIYKFHHKLYANGCGCSIVVEYVHQLQHLLRDFGLDDLADNFKV